MLPFYDVSTVIFDCDSTLSSVEGIDELAARKGISEQLAPLTIAAMEGRLKLEDIYARRLELIRPTRTDVAWLTHKYIDNTVSDARQVIGTLHAAGKAVHIVSGGIRQAVAGLARHLGVTDSNVHAVEVFFDEQGNYLGFDESSPLARNKGKQTICQHIIRNGGKAVMVGDGITDLEAIQEGIYFIGFGGVVCRRHIQAKAPDFITGPGLQPLLERLLEKPAAV